ncbi:MAG TPA: hypothetical protein VLT87_06270 [Thermoanaerobaculia bacterium]|nr:hypothetical protein [Thermoanaerobaculia bacterium]
MTQRGLSRVNLISLLALVFLVAVVAITPETREILGRLRTLFESRKAPPVAPAGPREVAAEEPPAQEVKDEAPQVMSPPPHVVRSPDGTFHPEPGYRWTNDDNANLDIYWCAGCVHPDHPNVIASEPEGQWHPAPGYDWVNPDGVNDLRVEWKPGKPHTEYEHVIADSQPGRWAPAPGYEWARPDNMHDLSVQPVSPPVPDPQ